MPDNITDSPYRMSLPVPTGEPTTPFQYLPNYVHPDGSINWTPHTPSLTEHLGLSWTQAGMGISGEAGIKGLKSIPGKNTQWEREDFADLWSAKLNVQDGMIQDPAYKPVGVYDQSGKDRRGFEYWNTDIHPQIKKLLLSRGYTPGNLTGDNAIETKSKVNSAMFDMMVGQAQQAYSDIHAWYSPGRVAGFVGVDLIATALTDPTTYATAGAGLIGKGLVVGTKVGLNAGAKQALKIAVRAGSTQTQAAAVQAFKILNYASRAKGPAFAQKMASTMWFKAGEGAIVNDGISALRASQATDTAQAMGDYNPQYTDINAIIDTSAGIFLPSLFHVVGKKFGSPSLHQTAIVKQMEVTGPNPITVKDSFQQYVAPSRSHLSFYSLNDIPNPLGGTARVFLGAAEVNKYKDLFRATGNPPGAWARTFGDVDWAVKADAAGVDHDVQRAWLMNHPSPEQILNRLNTISDKIQGKAQVITTPLADISFVRAGNSKTGLKPAAVKYQFQNPIDHALVTLSRSLGKIQSADQLKLLGFAKKATGMDDARIGKLVHLVAQEAKDRAVAAANKGQAAAVFDKPIWSVFVHEINTRKVKGVDLSDIDFSKIVNNAETEWSLGVKNEPALQKKLQVLLAKDVHSQAQTKQIAKIKSALNRVSKVREQIRSKVIGPAKTTNIPTDTGRPLNIKNTNLVLQDLQAKGKLFGKVGTQWQDSHVLTRTINRAADYFVSKTSGNGLDDIFYNSSDIVRQLGQWVISGSTIQNNGKLKTVIPLQTLWQQGQSMAAHYSGAHYMARSKLSDQVRAMLTQLVYKDANQGVVSLRAAFKSDAQFAAYRGMLQSTQYFTKMRKLGLQSGRLRPGVTQTYLPRELIRTATQHSDELYKAFHNNFIKGWSKPDAPIHLQTFRSILKDQGQFDQFLKSNGHQPGQQAIKMTVADLPLAVKQEYLAALNSTDGVLAKSAKKAVRRGLGQISASDVKSTEGWILADSDIQLGGFRIDSAKARSIHDSVWADPAINKYLKKDIEQLIASYATTTAPHTFKAQWLKDITGRTDIGIDQFMAFARGQARGNTVGQLSNHVQAGFKAIQDKINALSGLHRMPDDEAFKLTSTAFGMIQKTLTSAVNAREGLQTLGTEVVPMLIYGGLNPHLANQQILHILQMVVKGDRSILSGIPVGTNALRLYAMRGLSESDTNLAHSASSWQNIVNSTKQVKQVATSSQPSLPKKVQDTILSAGDLMVQGSRVLGAGDIAHRVSSVIAFRSSVAEMSNQFDQIVKASGLLKDLFDSGGKLNADTLQAISRHSGINDKFKLKALRASGILNPEVIEGLQALNTADSKLISKYTASHTFDYSKALDALDLIEDPLLRDKAQKALTVTRGYLQNRTDMLVSRPTIATLDTTASNSVFKRIQRMFTSYTTAFYMQHVRSGFLNESKGKALLTMGLAMLGEFIWYNVNKMVYRGYTLEDIKDQLQNHPGATMTQYAMRSPLLGPAGTFLMGVQGTLGGGSPNHSPESNIVGIAKSLINVGSGGGTAKSKAKDMDNILRVMPVTNTPYWQMMSKLTGYRSTGNWIYDTDQFKSVLP